MSSKERFVILARDFLDSYNPQPRGAVVILDCILAVPEKLIDSRNEQEELQSLRCVAWAFVQDAAVLDSMMIHWTPADLQNYSWHSEVDIAAWIKNWWAINVK